MKDKGEDLKFDDYFTIGKKWFQVWGQQMINQ